MKNFTKILTVFIVVFIFQSCSVSKEARVMKKSINGNWVLQSISTEGINSVVKAKIFNEAESGCFIGSTWNFIANNSMGSYTLVNQKKDCPVIKRFIRWSIYEPKGEQKKIQFKRLDDNKKPMDDNSGFRLSVIQLDDNIMKLKSEITFAGNPSALIYNFVRK